MLKHLLVFLVIFSVLGLIVAIIVLAGFLKISEWRFIRKSKKKEVKCLK